MPHRPPAAVDPRPLVALDWSFSAVHVTFDGEEVEKLASAEELLARLTAPHRIVAESTFESWDPQRRRDLAARIRAAGHELLVYRPIHTARSRPEEMAKSDENDARLIYRIAAAGRLHLYPLPDPDPAWEERRAELNREYQRIRLEGGKAELTAAAAAVLGPYRELPEDTRVVLGNGKAYSPTLLAAVYFAASRCATRAEFERLLGLHGSAYPSLLRSEVHHHSFRHARRRGVAWRVYRRELRRVFWRVRTHLDR